MEDQRISEKTPSNTTGVRSNGGIVPNIIKERNLNTNEAFSKSFGGHHSFLLDISSHRTKREKNNVSPIEVRPPDSSYMGIDVDFKVDDQNSLSFREESLYSFIQEENIEGVE